MTKANENYQTMKSIFHNTFGCELNERKGGRFVFSFYFNSKTVEADIEILDLSTRSYNGLKRAGYHSIGELAQDICAGKDIRRIRNCGDKSYSEILEKLFLYNLANIPPEKVSDYIEETIRKNGYASSENVEGIVWQDE